MNQAVIHEHHNFTLRIGLLKLHLEIKKHLMPYGSPLQIRTPLSRNLKDGHFHGVGDDRMSESNPK